MLLPLILWLDFVEKDRQHGLPGDLSRHYRVQHIQDMEVLPDAVRELAPNVICFDFDYPGPSELALLQKIKLLYPSVPILMLTENHSTELVIWALRSRVWDCLLKPMSAGEIVRRLNIMLPVIDGNNGQRPRDVFMPGRSSFKPCIDTEAPSQDKTCKVLPYLMEHFHEKVVLSDVARLCHMGVCEFSRTFRREQGMTFRDYLVRLRVEAAAGILRNTSTSVLDVACSVGVNDPSQFSRLFRRHMGVTPTAYRKGSKTIRSGFGAVPEAGAP
jgi:AraC-like DNA-binding protein/CheY-like chemotaxis protein